MFECFVLTDDDDHLTYEEAAVENTTNISKVLDRLISQVLMREDKLILRSTYCQEPRLLLKPFTVDMDGLFIACHRFVAIRMPFDTLYFKRPITPAAPFVGKTPYKQKLTYAFFLCQYQRFSMHLMCNASEPLQLFPKEYQKQFNAVEAANLQRPTILRNVFRMDRIKVAEEDVPFMLELLDLALAAVKARMANVSDTLLLKLLFY